MVLKIYTGNLGLVQRLLSIVLFAGLCQTSYCQVESVDFGMKQQEIRAEAAVVVPFDRDVPTGAQLELTYSNYANYGLGFRTGLRFMPDAIGNGKLIGVPVMVAFRSRSRDFNARLSSAAGSTKSYLESYGSSPTRKTDAFSSFILGLFNRAEVFAGFSPSYAWDAENMGCYSSHGFTYRTGVRQNQKFCLTADLGVSLEYRIWRFYLNITPTVHCNVLKSFIIHNEGPGYTTDVPYRWYVSIGLGLSYVL